MQIDFVPVVIVQLWRVLVWTASLGLLGSVFVFLPRAWSVRDHVELMPRWTLDLYVGVGFFIVQACVSQAIHWDDTMTLQGLPLTTIAIAWCVAARLRRARAGI